MARTIQEIMAHEPRTVSVGEPVSRAAQIMRDDDIGDVIVLDDGGSLRGIVTDRDIAIRAVADGRDCASTPVESVCTEGPVTVAPGDEIGVAVQRMRDHAIRRLPVVDNGRVVGAVSLGDLAMERDPNSALADISAAPPDD